MTGARFRLEVFEPQDPTGDSVTLTEGAIEDAKLASFEQGYAAGWDDAVAAQDEIAARLRADLARNLEDLSFTYVEAHRHVLGALEPLLRDMVGKVLPVIARDTLGPVVLEQLMPLARDLAGVPIEVVVSPSSRALVEPLIAQNAGIPMTVTEEPTLADGQVYLRFANRERRIDLDGVVAAIGAAVSDFFQIDQEQGQEQQRVSRNG